MNDREKILSAAVAAMVALWGANLGWGKYQSTLERNLNTQQTVAQQLSTARTATARGQRAQQKLLQWQRQSLPTDPDIAKSLYQDWLQQELTTAGLKVIDLNTLPSNTRQEGYQNFSFKILAEGNLGQFTNFLHEFYRAQHLHRISKADLVPSSNRQALTISLTVDGLSLTDASRKDQLAEGTNDTLKQSLQQFQTSIVGRNLFTAYQPPRPPQAVVAKQGEDTEAAQAKVSGIHSGKEGWLMSVRMEKSGKVYYYREGDTIQIGRFEGTIEQLDGDRRRAIVATGSQRMEIRLGKTLAEAIPLDEQAS